MSDVEVKVRLLAGPRGTAQRYRITLLHAVVNVDQYPIVRQVPVDGNRLVVVHDHNVVPFIQTMIVVREPLF
jgi:hypothetical protein